MAKVKTDKREKVKTDERDSKQGVTFFVPQFGRFLMAGNKVFEAWTAIGNELVEFSKARADQNIEMSKAMAQLPSINEAIELQAKYAQSMIYDYLNEARKLTDLGTQSLIEGLAAPQRTTESGSARTTRR
jgi:hypothetical protein